MPKSTRKIRYLDLSRKSHQILLKIAEDAKWLLLNPNLQVNSKILRDRYHNILLKRGFAYYNGRIKTTKFLDACGKFFPDEIFDYIGKFSKKEKWFSALLESGYTDTACHPVRHLLLITLLGFTAQEFLTSFTDFKPFGDPPYPCLNHASGHYRELRISEYKVFDALTKKKTYRQPIAIFECDCGFIYQRFGPDKSEGDKFRFSSVREYGEIWENKLIKLWADLSTSTKEIGEQLGVTKWTVNRHAIRLNLPMNTDKTRSVRGYEKHHNPKSTFSARKLKYRKEWVQIRRNNRNATRKCLLDNNNFLYLWLRRNDREWFDKHLPKAVKIISQKPFLNWKEIDKQLSKEIKKNCLEILDIQSEPIRISITEIIRRVGRSKWIDKRRRKLPLTTKILDEYLESWADFMIRRVIYIKEVFIKENVLPTLGQFKVRAKLEGSISKNSPKVKETVQKALDEIKLTVNQD